MLILNIFALFKKVFLESVFNALFIVELCLIALGGLRTCGVQLKRNSNSSVC